MSYHQTHKSNWIHSEYWVAVVSSIIGALGVWYVYSLGLVKELTDAHAHLNFSKMLFESLTPGVSQIGYWPPLLHVLMAPFTQIPSLYETGLAGAVVILPFYVLGSVFCYKLVKLMTGNSVLSWSGAFLFMLNPYVIYYTATPMMEVMFLGNLMGVAYFIASWMYKGRLIDLIGTGIFVMLATLARYEGIILVPLVAMIIVAELIRRRRQFSEIQATVLLFVMVGAIGIGTIISYSWIFGGNPLAFMGGEWIRSADANSTNIRTEGNIFSTFQYLLHASYYMIGQNLIWFAAICLPFLFAIAKNRLQVLAVLSVLISPLLFIALALYQGSYNVAVPDLSPWNIFLNERYGLAWIGFVIISPMLLIGAVLRMESITRWVKYSGYVTAAAAITVLMYATADNLYTVAKTDKFFIVRNNINTPRASQEELAAFLGERYDFGKVLLTRADNDPVLSEAGIPLHSYIYEANFRYFEQSLDEPWIFARWVVMHNPDDQKDQWSVNNENVARRWAGNEQFEHFYELVYENTKRRVYKINDERVVAYAEENNFDLSQIPSVNREMGKWNPLDFYNKLQVSVSVKKN
ncbi:MAG TPA: hypothetical protein VEC17_00890 [Candidatus Binatia bacterium]|nr:hypothetical protein [Candidatus Binatia bacterium]